MQPLEGQIGNKLCITYNFYIFVLPNVNYNENKTIFQKQQLLLDAHYSFLLVGQL